MVAVEVAQEAVPPSPVPEKRRNRTRRLHAVTRPPSGMTQDAREAMSQPARDDRAAAAGTSTMLMTSVPLGRGDSAGGVAAVVAGAVSGGLEETPRQAPQVDDWFASVKVPEVPVSPPLAEARQADDLPLVAGVLAVAQVPPGAPWAGPAAPPAGSGGAPWTSPPAPSPPPAPAPARVAEVPRVTAPPGVALARVKLVSRRVDASGEYPGANANAAPRVDLSVLQGARVSLSSLEVYALSRLDGQVTMAELDNLGVDLLSEEWRALVRKAWESGLVTF
jgi:hypothetical protein